MAKKLTKQGDNFSLIIDKLLLESAGITEKTNLDVFAMGDTIMIKPKKSSGAKTDKKSEAKLKASANRIMDKYESVFKKLSKT